ncbi:MAG: hypothetical protein JW776_03385 [Candidatus Lokiarchaeota archaeon]|nr:hypothetical protein [Candidatus Lokiarchaeota archaeon]
MPKCYYCGLEYPNLTQCFYCKQHYCPDHLSTHQHDCPLSPIQNPYDASKYAFSDPPTTENEDLVPTSSAVTSPSSSNVYTDGSYYWYRKPDQVENPDVFDPSSGVKIPGILWPKLSEAAHVIISSILVLSLSISGFAYQFSSIPDMGLKILIIGFLSLMYLVAFLVHEFSHRQTAIHYGLQTKFRLFTMGVIMTAVCIFLPVKFALPGAVVVIGLENISRETGMIKLAGPLSNLILGTILFVLGIAPLFSELWRLLLLTAASFNYMLGAFNLLPFSILDGENIRKWNPKIWLLVFILMVLMLILTLILTNTNILFN